MEHLIRPGCFGLVVCYEPQSEFCGACNFRDECGTVASARREKLAGLLQGLSPRKRTGSLPVLVNRAVPPATVEPKSKPEPIVEKEVAEESNLKAYKPGELSKKAQELQVSLERFGYGNAPELLRNGVMPLQGVTRLKYFRLACQSLLTDGYLDRQKLKETLKAELNWNDQTASSHLSIIASYMVGTGVVTVDGDRYIRVARS